MLRKQGLNKFVKVTFPEYLHIAYLVRNLANELGIKVNSHQYPTPMIEFIWSPELDHEVVEIRLEQYKENFLATVEFSEKSDFPISELI